MHAAARSAIVELKRAWPYALALGLILGAVVVAGANLSNAFPSQQRPFGWPGPSSFENGVAMVRPDLVLAASLPALALGATALSRREPGMLSDVGIVVAVDAGLIVAASALAAIIGAIGAAKTTAVAFMAFTVAHALLALAFYSIAFACGAIMRKHALPLALALWLGFESLFDHVTQTILFRQAGYDQLTAGNFPPWFFVAQACSPMAAYRGVLILWDRKFMDYLEQAALGKAALPAWLNPGTFIAFTLAVWIALPLAIAALAWWLRARAVSRSAAVVRREEPA